MVRTLAVGVGLLAVSGCDSVPGRSTLLGWPPGEALVAGNCSFLLTSATLYHSDSWHLKIEVDAKNTGPEPTSCGLSARAMSAADETLTEEATVSDTLGSGQTWTKSASAREANMTGLSNGNADGVWVYVEASDGVWPLGDTHEVVVSPELIRPPG